LIRWSGDHIGIFNTLGTVCRAGPNKGKRSYAARGYFAANSHRSNLHVLCEASVTSVQLEGDKAVGVSFIHQSKSYNVGVRREVVISCGSIQTPQILELSGIGDPEVLKAAGIECKIENKAIGNNLQDHVLTWNTWEVTPGNPTLEVIYDPDVMQGAMKQLAETQSGPLTGISSTQGFFPYKVGGNVTDRGHQGALTNQSQLFASEEEQASILKSVEDSLANATLFQKKQYERTVAHLKDDKSANLQVILVCHNFDSEQGHADQSKLFPPLEPGKPMSITAAVCLQYPLSRGSVHIKSADINDHPTLDPGFLKHEADTAVLAAGLKMLDKIATSKAMEGKIAKRTFPRDQQIDLSDPEQAQAAVRDSVFSEYHPVGSCAVGDAVDAKLRVKGLRNLRVADASVFPNHVSGNCVASVYAVAEKAADLIKEDWEYAALGKATDRL
jgi:choline dehydrogenase-like flavoprotein